MAVRYTTLRGLLAGQDPEAPALEKLTPEGPVRLTAGEAVIFKQA